jgi:hypothetical protein
MVKINPGTLLNIPQFARTKKLAPGVSVIVNSLREGAWIKNLTPFILALAFSLLTLQTAKADNSTTSTSSTISLATTTLATLTSTSTPSSAAGTSTSGSVLGLQAPAVPPIIQEINNAKILLADITLNHELVPVYRSVKSKKTGKTTKIISKYNLGDKDIALAILDPSNNNIITTVGRLNGTSMVFPDPAVSVKLTYFNGVNSRFEVDQPSGGAVIAVKYLISEEETGSKAAIEAGLSPVVYVPYSQNLDSPEVIAYGQNYLNGVINTVAGQLYGLPSHAIPGETITQAVPPSFIKALIYAEHSDTSSILNGNVQGSLDQMNILLALNGPDTYKYSVSNDGYASRGISQFVKSTYESLVQRHPEAFLNPDYVAAMQDHVTSIKAMYLLLDDYAGDVRIKAAAGFDASRVFDYGAASYNGGTTRVANAVNAFGDSWNEDKSGSINAVQSQVNSLTAQVKSLKLKVKKSLDKKTKAIYQSELANDESQLSSASSQLATLKSSALKNATVNYLAKVYKVIQYFNDQQLAMNN